MSVLADTEHAHHAAWNAVLEPFGMRFSWEEYLTNFVGIADKMVAERLNLPDAEDVVERKRDEFRRALEAKPPFVPETVELLRELSREFRMAVVSSSYHSEVRPPLERSGLIACFETVICGDDAKNLKPAPDLYLLAVERLGVHAPLVIEDSDAGVAAGKAAGLEVLRVSSVQKMAYEVRRRLR
jgi:HAD superfamily hydrolase (TIGR01509 family)